MQKSAKIALIAVVVVIVLGGAGFYWFFLRSDAPPETSLSALTGGTTGAASSRATPDGTWTVQQSGSVFVGYRMMELFGGETIKKEAVGRTGDVKGTMTIAGQEVTAVDITADVTKLKSDQSRRDNYIQHAGLETSTFTTATFKLTTPIKLPSTPKKGEQISVQAVGDLTAHGVTKNVTIPLDAVWNGDTVSVSGKLDFQIADYNIERISIPTVTIDTAGKLEIALTFVPQ